MSLVEIAMQPWGSAWKLTRGRFAPNAGVELEITDLDEGAVTIYATGDPEGATLTPPIVSNPDGTWPGFIAPGPYLLTEPTDDTVRRVHAVPGKWMALEEVTNVSNPNYTDPAGVRAFEVMPDGEVLIGPNRRRNDNRQKSFPDLDYRPELRRLATRDLFLRQIADPGELRLGLGANPVYSLANETTLPQATIELDGDLSALAADVAEQIAERGSFEGRVLIGGTDEVVTFTNVSGQNLTGCEDGTGTHPAGAQVEYPSFPDGTPVGVSEGQVLYLIIFEGLPTPDGGTVRQTPGGSIAGRGAMILAEAAEDFFPGANGADLIDKTSSIGTDNRLERFIRTSEGAVAVVGATLTKAQAKARGMRGEFLVDKTLRAGAGVNGLAREVGARYTGILAESMGRSDIVTNGIATAGSGVLRMVPIFLEAGIPINGIRAMSGSAALVGGNNQWFALYDTSLDLLAQTSDDTNAAWAANAFKSLSFASAFTPTTSGIYLVGLLVEAGTPINYSGKATVQNANLGVPVYSGTSSTGLTSAAPDPAAAITGVAGTPYVAVF